MNSAYDKWRDERTTDNTMDEHLIATVRKYVGYNVVSDYKNIENLCK